MYENERTVNKWYRNTLQYTLTCCDKVERRLGNDLLPFIRNPPFCEKLRMFNLNLSFGSETQGPSDVLRNSGPENFYREGTLGLRCMVQEEEIHNVLSRVFLSKVEML